MCCLCLVCVVVDGVCCCVMLLVFVDDIGYWCWCVLLCCCWSVRVVVGRGCVMSGVRCVFA